MKNKLKGFSLIELLVAIAIVGILGSIAYPSYLNQINSSNRAEAMAALVILAASQERFFTANNRYASSITLDPPPVNTGLGLTGLSETGLYNITVTNNAPITTFTLTATPVGWVDNQCGNFILTNTGVRQVSGDFDNDGNDGDSADPGGVDVNGNPVPDTADPDDIAACWG
ncbi:type IV pilin protein [Eionea flava]